LIGRLIEYAMNGKLAGYRS